MHTHSPRSADFSYLFNECAHRDCFGLKRSLTNGLTVPSGVSVDANMREAGIASFNMKIKGARLELFFC